MMQGEDKSSIRGKDWILREFVRSLGAGGQPSGKGISICKDTGLRTRHTGLEMVEATADVESSTHPQ